MARHQDSGVDIDISRAWLPFEMEAISGATRESIGGVVLPIARAEDLVIFKAIAWRPQDRELGAAIEVDRLRDLDDLLARLDHTRA